MSTTTPIKVVDHTVTAVTKGDPREKPERDTRPLGGLDNESLLILKHAVNAELANR